MRIRQLRTITAAYKSLTLTEPILPSPESPLPALLAVRATLNLIKQSKENIRETEERLAKAQAELDGESQKLKDALFLSSALEERTERLRQVAKEQSKQSVEDIAEGLMQEQERRKSYHAQRLRGLVKAFNSFTNEHLAIMVAAEELGGPIVGDTFDLNDDALKVGFTHQGKAKKITGDESQGEAKRRRRNEEIWGRWEDRTVNGKPKSEKASAAAAFRSLMERLLNAAAGDEDSSPYIDIPRETAAVRFLVRAKVAVFHPQDARKLRLLDLGADLNE
ncbi:MAG: hypothetical protein Q9163_000789 [Psora crenata]